MFEIRFATETDVPVILDFIRDFAEYEDSLDQVSADEGSLRKYLFGERKCAEVIIGCRNERPVGFALFFHNFSTFLGKPGMYVEDLFVIPEERGRGYGKRLLAYLARLADKRDCGRLEWAVVEWNQGAMDFYKKIGARPLEEWSIYRLAGHDLRNLAEGAG